MLSSPKRRGRKRPLEEAGEVPTLFDLCEKIVQQTEQLPKRKRGRPRLHDTIYEPKSLKALCEQVLNVQLPRRRGRKRKRTLLQSPQSLKELCKAVLEANKVASTFRGRRGRRRRVYNPPSLKHLCKLALGEEVGKSGQRRGVVRPQRRKKFNKKWLGFADVPSVMKASYRERLKRKVRGNFDDDWMERRKKLDVKPKVYMRRMNNRVQKPETLFVKRELTDSDSDEIVHPSPPLKTYKRKPKSNGNLVVPVKEEDLETAFRVYVPDKSIMPEKNQITIKFTDLLKEIQKVTLPSSTWKIKIILYNQQISQIVFSNKSTPERCVNVYRNSKYFDISFDKAFVMLLGAPMCVDSLEDLNSLLQIVHAIDENDPVLQYTHK